MGALDIARIPPKNGQTYGASVTASSLGFLQSPIVRVLLGGEFQNLRSQRATYPVSVEKVATRVCALENYDTEQLPHT